MADNLAAHRSVYRHFPRVFFASSSWYAIAKVHHLGLKYVFSTILQVFAPWARLLVAVAVAVADLKTSTVAN